MFFVFRIIIEVYTALVIKHINVDQILQAWIVEFFVVAFTLELDLTTC